MHQFFLTLFDVVIKNVKNQAVVTLWVGPFIVFEPKEIHN